MKHIQKSRTGSDETCFTEFGSKLCIEPIQGMDGVEHLFARVQSGLNPNHFSQSRDAMKLGFVSKQTLINHFLMLNWVVLNKMKS